MSKRETIFDEISAERDYQDRKWGPEQDKGNTETDWEDYIIEYTDGQSSRTKGRPFRERMLKAAALAVAAIEAHDASQKSMKEDALNPTWCNEK